MLLEVALTVTTIGGAVATVVLSRRNLTAAETHAADAADTLAETRILTGDLQDLTARVNNAVAWVEWHHVQQVNTHMQLVDRHRDADAREVRLAEWQQALLGKARMPVLSVEELNLQFNALAERIGPLTPPVLDEPASSTPEHLLAVYGGEPGHYTSDAMPAELGATLELFLERRGVDVEELIAEGEPEGGDGPEPTVPETPDVETASAGMVQPDPTSAPTDDRHTPKPNPNVPGRLSARDQQIRMRDLARTAAAQRTSDEHAAVGAR